MIIIQTKTPTEANAVEILKSAIDAKFSPGGNIVRKREMYQWSDKILDHNMFTVDIVTNPDCMDDCMQLVRRVNIDKEPSIVMISNAGDSMQEAMAATSGAIENNGMMYGESEVWPTMLRANIKLENITKANAGRAREILFKYFDYVDKNLLTIFDDYKVDFIKLVYGENQYIIYDGEIAGIIGYYIPREDRKAAWISWFAVEDEFRNKGIGEAAIRKIEELVTEKFGISTFRVYTNTDNTPALKLYEKCGYKLEDGVYADNAVVLTKNGSKWGKEPIW